MFASPFLIKVSSFLMNVGRVIGLFSLNLSPKVRM